MPSAPTAPQVVRPSFGLSRARPRRFRARTRTATVEEEGEAAVSADGADGPHNGKEAAKVAPHRPGPKPPNASVARVGHQVSGRIATAGRAVARTATVAVLAGAGAMAGKAVGAGPNTRRARTPLPPQARETGRAARAKAAGTGRTAGRAPIM